AEKPERLVTPIVYVRDVNRSANRTAPIALDIDVRRIDDAFVISVLVEKRAGCAQKRVIAIEEKSVAVDHVAAGLAVILLDALAETVLRRKRAAQNVHIFQRVVRRLVPIGEALRLRES